MCGAGPIGDTEVNMVRSLGAQIGLLAFAVAIVAGLYAGNSAVLTLTRALLAMVAGAAVGQFGGWAAKAILRDHLQRKKLQIDRAHLAAVAALTGEAGPEPPGEPVKPTEVE